VPGDVIIAVEGKPVASSAQLAALLDDYRAGSEISVAIWRDGKEMQIKAKLKADTRGP
jgi:serine protease Do